MSEPDFSKIGKSNVRKSKTHERRVAHMLTDWTGVEFRRRRVEGRDATVVERESTADVIPVKGTICCSIEAKSGKGFSLDALLTNYKTSLFTTWWHQATFDCQILKNVFGRDYYPLLFFKPHINFDWVAADKRLFDLGILKPRILTPEYRKDKLWFPALTYDYFDMSGNVTMNTSHSKNNKVMESIPLPALYLCRWKDFENSIDPKSIFIENI